MAPFRPKLFEAPFRHLKMYILTEISEVNF